MHKEGLETYNDLIILFLCTSIRQDKEIEIAYHHTVITTYMIN